MTDRWPAPDDGLRPPPLIGEGDEVLLAAVAGRLASERRTSYPPLVAAGKIAEGEAADAIRIMAAISRDWSRALAILADLPDEGEHPDRTATQHEKMATLTRAADRAQARMARAWAAIREAEAADETPRIMILGHRIKHTDLIVPHIHGNPRDPLVTAWRDEWTMANAVAGLEYWQAKGGPLLARHRYGRPLIQYGAIIAAARQDAA